jgi:hypothetical protein
MEIFLQQNLSHYSRNVWCNPRWRKVRWKFGSCNTKFGQRSEEFFFGEAQIIITIYNNCKLMLLNMSPYKILIGLALDRSFNCEDDLFIEKIKQLMTAEANTKQ